MTLSGHCLCGATTFTIDSEPLFIGHDHCDDCQRQTGTSYSLVVIVPTDKLKIVGPTKDYIKKGDSGKDGHRIFCSECGSPIAHRPDSAPDITAVKGGVFEKAQRAELAAKADTDVYGRNKLPNVPKLKNFFERMSKFTFDFNGGADTVVSSTCLRQSCHHRDEQLSSKYHRHLY
ncbi:hypothetical protein FRB94_006931 [Tulasnella sp. JGI-2019a]|nr:hypothetical protein FRB94_006931 [Tulasnella sp. JGI-2019a]KAG9000483.1 hypothetical protein FRB93_012688 [Tulasnella sp. JGI-2019a]